MRTRDILHMCLQNLTRRKSRSVLTVMGVVIGCCAIVIMVSLGFGTQEAQEKMLANMGDLTMIEIYSYGNNPDSVLNESMVNNFRQIDGVLAATPKLELGNYYYPQMYTGPNRRYECSWATVMGADLQSCIEMGYELIDGRFPEKAGEVVVGQYFAYNFFDTLRPDGKNYISQYDGGWDEEGNLINIPDPWFDPMNATITMEMQLSNGSTIKNDLKVVGIMKEDYNRGYETSQGVLMETDSITTLINQAMIQEGIKKDITYSQAYVKAIDIDHVADVQSEIDQYGFDTWSMESIREPLQEEARQKQLLLGGLGAISLLVAAIGIANTMVMSISERTREIGIMKSLGCYVSNIRTMFLTEAGIIGFVGGVIGSIVSLIAMVVINIISFGTGFSMENLKYCFLGGETVTRTSVIPFWLILFAMIFSILIGLISGFLPANKAVKISALEAIKSSE